MDSLIRLADLLLEFPDQPGFGRTKVCITRAVMASTTMAEQSVRALTSASERFSYEMLNTARSDTHTSSKRWRPSQPSLLVRNT